MVQMTERELLAISDHIRSHMGLVEKYSMYSQIVQDQEIKQLLQSHQNIMQEHVQTLRSMVQPQAGAYTTQAGTYQPQMNIPQGINQPGFAGRGGF